MYVTCLNCGKTNIPGGTANCPVCSRPLPKAMMIPSSASASRPTLVDTRGRQYILNSSAATVVGSRGCAVMLSDPGVPPQAARLIPRGSGFLLEDMSGIVKVNGMKVSAPASLQPGDKINIGAANLTYQGPPTTTIVPTSPKTVPAVISSPLVISSPPVVSSSPPVTLKSWGADRPLLEGTIEFIDGPHRVEKGSMGGKMAASLVLGLFSSSLMMLPFWMKQELTVWYLRITAYPTGRIYAVVMRGEPGSLPQMSDFIAIWGEEKDGNILMKRGYNYITNSYIPLKT